MFSFPSFLGWKTILLYTFQIFSILFKFGWTNHQAVKQYTFFLQDFGPSSAQGGQKSWGPKTPFALTRRMNTMKTPWDQWKLSLVRRVMCHGSNVGAQPFLISRGMGQDKTGQCISHRKKVIWIHLVLHMNVSFLILQLSIVHFWIAWSSTL